MISGPSVARNYERAVSLAPLCTRQKRSRVCKRVWKQTERRQTAPFKAGRVAAASGPPDVAGGGSEPAAAAAFAATAGAHAATTDSQSPPPGGLFARAAVQVLALAAALACLILLPAHARRQLAQRPLSAAGSYALYLLFFASGTISRMLRYGRLAEARRDAQRSSGSARLALLLFAALLMPAGHWAAWWDPSLARLAAAAPKAAAAVARLLPLVGYSLMLTGWALNAAAAAALGRAYNRVVAPEELVTSGPYALMQHPIYTSYMLLFVGHALSLGSPAAAALLLGGCLWYYGGRTQLEEVVLEGAFGERYRQYRHSTGRFLPRLS